MKTINWVGVIVALIVSQALGMAWYGFIFSEKWMALSGMTEADVAGDMTMSYVWGAVQNLVVIVGLALLAGKLGKSDWMGGARLGLFVCVAFALATYSLRFIYGSDNTGLIPIDAGYMLIQYALSGAIVAGLKLGKKAA
ncbi:MAG: DUF1761 domain-containing protein [Caulobacter sp.]|nr:DUF1761 domain-containing protein [Caulobacter sp.]